MFSNRLIKLLKENGVKNAELAKYLKMSKSAVSKWISGDAEPRPETLRQMAKFFNVSVGYLINEENLMLTGKREETKSNIFPSVLYSPEEPEPINGMVWLPIYETKISATPGIQDIVRADIIGWHTAPKSSWNSSADPYQKPFSMKVVGNSMSPIIKPGDYLTIRPAPFIIPETNQIYAVKIKDDSSDSYGIVVKRVQIDAKRKIILLRSDNPDFPVYVADEYNTVIMGRVISMWRPL